LIDTGCPRLTNMGDVAMLKVAAARLRNMLCAVILSVFTDDAAALERHIPDAIPISHSARVAWLDEQASSGRLPLFATRRLGRTGSVAKAHAGIGAIDDALDHTDLLVVSGQGTITDAAHVQTLQLLATAEKALYRPVPVALVGQGIGPLTSRDLLERARAVLPLTDLVSVREGISAPDILHSLGMADDRIVITGDDAIELAREATPDHLGSAVGVNLRIAPLAAQPATLEWVRPVLLAAAGRRGAQLLPLPISFNHYPRVSDYDTIAALLQGSHVASDGGASLDSPAAVIRQAGRCRVVVTGAYHAAVFALSQGVPVICLGRSSYYLDKFLGLQHQFGCGCEIVYLDHPSRVHHLELALASCWHDAPALRPLLLAAADRQILSGRAAYGRLASLLAGYDRRRSPGRRKPAGDDSRRRDRRGQRP
jgi:polysaccharide pyruvyl transferase WcaK-like protein